METLSTVLLRHRMRGGDHFDWMLEPPAGTAIRQEDVSALLAWRLELPSWQWRPRAHRAPLHMQELNAHRRIYLHRTGPISHRRGTVQRIDAGRAVVRAWHDDGGYLILRLRHFRGLVHLTRQPGLRWQLHLAAT